MSLVYLVKSNYKNFRAERHKQTCKLPLSKTLLHHTLLVLQKHSVKCDLFNILSYITILEQQKNPPTDCILLQDETYALLLLANVPLKSKQGLPQDTKPEWVLQVIGISHWSCHRRPTQNYSETSQ